MLQLTPALVESTFGYCLYKDEELKDSETVPAGAIRGEGVRMHCAFHPERLKTKIPVICDMLDELPDSFRNHDGDSFLNVCKDKHNQLWTGVHSTCDLLVSLGYAIGKIQWVLPRELWPIFGGIPNLRVEKEVFFADPNYKDMSKYREGRERSHLVQTWLKSFKKPVMDGLIGDGTKEEDIVATLIRTLQLRDQAEIADGVVRYMVLWLESDEGRSFLKHAHQVDDVPLIRVPATFSEDGQKQAAETLCADPTTLTVSKVSQVWYEEGQSFMTNCIYRTGSNSGISEETWHKVNYGAPDTAEIVVDTFIGWLNSHVGRCFISKAFELKIPTTGD